MIKFLLIMMFSTSAFTQVNTGETITANNFNNSTYSIGDIKMSVLNYSEFTEIHGDCWKQMNANIPLSGTDLGNHIANNGSRSYTQIPNASGRFLRNSGGAAPTLGSTQGDAIRNITGTYHAYGMSNNDVSRNSNPSGAFYDTSTNDAGRSGALGGSKSYAMGFDASKVVPTASENRPINLSVNMFVKVNNTCNTIP